MDAILCHLIESLSLVIHVHLVYIFVLCYLSLFNMCKNLKSVDAEEVQSGEKSRSEDIATTGDAIDKLIADLSPDSGVPVCENYAPSKPKPGFKYVFTSTNKKFENNYRFDGWRFRQWGYYQMEFNEAKCRKTYCLHRISAGKDRECFSDAFVRRSFTSSMYPGRTLVWYIGDENVVPKVLPQGNAKKAKTLARNFVPVPESTRIELKESAQQAILSGKTAVHIHEERLRSDDSRTHHRDLNQVQNFYKATKRSSRISQDAFWAIWMLYFETEFICDIVMAPSLAIVCFLQSKCIS